MFPEISTSFGKLVYEYDSIVLWPTEAIIDFLTAAQTCETKTYLSDEAFDSDEIKAHLKCTPASPTEVQVAVNIDGAGFGPDINVDITPIAGETGWVKFVAGTSFTPTTRIVLSTSTIKGSGTSLAFALAIPM